MDFGKITNIDEADFSLPPPHPFSKQTLSEINSKSPKKLYVGPSIWANKDWLGKLYPSGAKDKDLLYHYARQFNTIELNVTHYQIPTKDTILRWCDAVTPSFKFCPKWPQIISHEHQLHNCQSLSDEFVESIQNLGDHLGTTFLQLGPAFSPRQFHTLEKFLRHIPAGFPVAVEFRHPEWFGHERVWIDTLQLLQSLGMGTVMSDVAGRRDVLHQSLTTSAMTLRFVGNELHPTDYSRTDAWVAQVVEWLSEGLDTAYIFIHCGENRFAPELTKYWIERLNKHGHWGLEVPKIKPQAVQTSLF
jgi:uncharacterized protein YecE (DUF72 family)